MTPLSGDRKSHSATLYDTNIASTATETLDISEGLPTPPTTALEAVSNDDAMPKKALKLFRAINARFHHIPIRIGQINQLCKFIESGKDQWPKERHTYLCDNSEELCATVCVIHGEIFLFFDLNISIHTTYSTVQFVYNYTTEEPFVLLRVKRPSDNPDKPFNHETRPMKVKMFNDSLRWYDKLKSVKRLVNTFAIIKLKELAKASSGQKSPYNDESGIVQPAYTIDLQKLILYKPYSTSNLTNIFRDVLGGIRTIHLNGLAHRDIKPDNILCRPNGADDLEAVITDFGFMVAEDSSPHWVQQKLGNPIFWPPDYHELDSPATMRDHQNADSWAMGVVLYHTLTKTEPYWISEYDQMVKDKRTQRDLNLQLIWLGSTSDQRERFHVFRQKVLNKGGPYWSVIHGLLDPNPATRLTAAKADDLFNHLLADTEPNNLEPDIESKDQESHPATFAAKLTRQDPPESKHSTQRLASSSDSIDQDAGQDGDSDDSLDTAYNTLKSMAFTVSKPASPEPRSLQASINIERLNPSTELEGKNQLPSIEMDLP